MKNNALKIILAFGVISILLIFIIQFYWLKITYNQHEREFDKDVHIALKSVALKISDYLNTEPGIINPVLQLSSEYFVVSIDDTIDHTVLEFFLKNEFDNVNIKADFEYGSYNCFENKMEYGKYISYNEDGIDNIKPTTLQSFHSGLP